MLRRLCISLMAPAIMLALAACNGSGIGRESGPVVTQLTTTTTTTPQWVGRGEDDEWWAVDAVCLTANDDALADAHELLSLHTVPSGDALAEFYRRRSTQLEAVVAELRGLTPPASVADRWLTALDQLDAHAQWFHEIAPVVADEGLEADQTPHPGLENFRQLMIYGACHALLDVS